jgi:hypothetical protein
MRKAWRCMGWFVAVLLGLSGCQSSEPNLKPILAEDYTVPPEEDARFSEPPAFPKETLNSGSLKKPPTAGMPSGAPKTPSRFGAGPGMGGY